MYGLEWCTVYHKRVILVVTSWVANSKWPKLNSLWITFKMGNKMSNSPAKKLTWWKQHLSMLFRVLLSFWEMIFINHAVIKNGDCAAQWKLPTSANVFLLLYECYLLWLLYSCCTMKVTCFSYCILAMMINIQMQNTFLWRRTKHGPYITG